MPVNYTGIDNSSNLIAEAKKAHPRSKFIEGDLLDIPLPDTTQDLVVAIASLHHIPSEKLRKLAVQEMHRILKSRGKLAVTCWNLHQQKYKKYLNKAKTKSIFSLGYYKPRDTFIPWGKTGIRRYYYAFQEQELETLLKQAGFEILEKYVGNNFLLICQKK